jgi:hypothetical protein
MTLMSRLLSGLFLLTALLLALTSFSIDWLLELYAPTDAYGNRISLLESQRKEEQLSRELASTYQRIRCKDRIIDELQAGEITLIEAASGFRALHTDPRTWHHPQLPLPAHDDGVSWSRLVIEWNTTAEWAKRSMGQSKNLRQRLETELQEQLDYFGNVTLPD